MSRHGDKVHSGIVRVKMLNSDRCWSGGRRFEINNCFKEQIVVFALYVPQANYCFDDLPLRTRNNSKCGEKDPGELGSNSF